MHEVGATDQEFLCSVHIDLHLAVRLHQAVEGAGLGRSHQTLQLSSREVLGYSCQLGDVNIRTHLLVGHHLPGVDVQDLRPALLLGQTDLYLDLQPARSEQGVIHHVPPVGHPDNEDVVELVHSVNLAEKLVDHSVVDPRAVAPGRATSFADGVDFIKDDDVKARVRPKALLFLLGVFKQTPNVGLGLTDVFVKDLGSVDNLWLPGVEHLADLTSHQSLSCTRRSKQKDSLDVLATKLLHDLGREDARGKGSSEDGIEFCVQAPDAHLGEVPVGVDYLRPLDLPLALAHQVEAAALHLLPGHHGVDEEQATRHLAEWSA